MCIRGRVTGDIDFAEHGEDDSYRRMLEEKAKTEGAQVLHDMLSAVDPPSAKAIHPNNVKWVIRALEYYCLLYTSAGNRSRALEI